FKRMLPRLWARRRRRAAAAAIGLAASILAITTLSMTWRRQVEFPPMASHEVRPQSSPLAGGNQTIDGSVDGRPNALSAARPAHEAAPSAGPVTPPPAEIPEELERPQRTEIAAVPPPAFPAGQQAAPPAGPVQQSGPQSGLANAEPFQPPAKQVAAAGQTAKP